MLTVLKSVEQELLKATIAGEQFSELFFANAQDMDVADYLKSVLDS